MMTSIIVAYKDPANQLPNQPPSLGSIIHDLWYDYRMPQQCL